MTPLRRLAIEVEKLELYAVGRILLLSSVIGLVAGLGAIAFQLLCQLAAEGFLGQLLGFRPSGPAGERALFHSATIPLRAWLIPLVPALGGLLAGLIVSRFAPEAAGHGTDEAVDAFHRRRGIVRGRVPIVKTIASALTIGSGGSGGREGPIAQIGAGFGSFLSQRLALPERERRILLAAGIGAGVGSIFRAPLAGALFAAEVLYSDPEFESDVIIPAAIASIVAYCIFSLKFGFGALFATPRFTFHSVFELIPYTVLAAVVALAAGLFVRVFYGTHAFFARLRIPPAAKPMLGGLAAGGLGLLLLLISGNLRVLDVLSFGYGSIQEALLGRLSLSVLLLIGLGKLLTTSFSIGSGGSGGVFGPSMVIGGSLGGVVGILANHAMPLIVTQPAAFVPVGMAGFFAAAANTPISTLIMVSEMIGNYQLLLPSLWVCAIAYLMGRRWSLYQSQVPSRADSPAHRGAILAGALRGMRVGDVVAMRPVHVLRATESLKGILRAFTQTSQYCFPVVDESGAFMGSILLDQLREHMESDGAAPLIAHDFVGPKVSLSVGDDLEEALRRLVALDAAELPITDPARGNRVVGLLSRRDIVAVYSQHQAAAGDST